MERTNEREQEDKELCEYVFKDKLCVEGVDVVKVFRLGVKVNGRERPLVACLSDTRVKWDIIKKGKDLKEIRKDAISKFKIGVDRTKREREQDAILKEKLQEKRREGGRWVIRKGRIVRLTEGSAE